MANLHPSASTRPALLILIALSAGAPVHAQTATLSAPDTVMVGAPIELTWSGPTADREFISVDEAGAAESSYGDYVYADRDQPTELPGPDVPGRYVLRYHSGSAGYAVLASHVIEVVDTEATFQPLAPVEAGAQVTIPWVGPGYDLDFISIDPVGTDDRQYGVYAYARTSPVSIRAPDAAGEYVVRYHLGGTYRVIGSTPLTVGGVQASLTAPSEVQAGGSVEVTWEGPNGTGDYISLDTLGAPESVYGAYTYTRVGSPLPLRVPDRPGPYVIRYHMGQSDAVIGSVEVTVLPNTATVSAAGAVVGGTEFPVEWTGPSNAVDFVTIVPAGADRREHLDYAYTREGTPVTLRAPLDPGAYELRYMTGQSLQVLASAPVEVTPGAVPGTLRVVSGAEPAVPGPGLGAVEVILDASGSMLQRIDGERRIDIAKDALSALIGHVVPAGTPFALRVFGNREAESCRTDLEIPVAPLDPTSVEGRIRAIEAINLARTPIAASLRTVPADLAGVAGPVVVLLVTDGEDTCDGDPGAAVAELTRAGLDVRVNIIGFAIDDQALREQFDAWARAGNGRYLEANDAEQLTAAIGGAMRVAYEVLEDDEVIETGIVNGEPLALPAGTYRVRLLASPSRELGEVTVESGVERVVDAG